MQKFKFLIIVLLTTINLFSQVGDLKGTIRDGLTSETLIGANIYLVGTKFGTSSDFDGKYLIKNIPIGIYDIRFSLMGFKEVLISKIEIKENTPTILDNKLSENTYETNEVIISAKAYKNTEASILTNRKRSGAISDGFSAEQVKKSTDATSGDALKRVTGLMLVDNKYLYIRGVSDRYNQTTLNGASIASTSSEKKSFSFDILPSNLIDYSNVAKTATPDLPGDFSGGLVQISTIDFPESKLLKSSYSSAFNVNTTQKMVRTSQQNKNDWLAVDNGSRNLPIGKNISEIQSNLKNTWAPSQNIAPMNQSFALTFGDKFEYDESIFGVISSLSYKNNYNRNHFNLTEIEGGIKTRDFAGDIDKYSALWSGLLDLNLQFDTKNKFNFKNNFSLSGEDQVIFKTGIHHTDGERNDYTIEWNERNILNSQLSGEHDINASLIKWQFNHSTSIANLKDRRTVEYARAEGSSTDDPFISKPGERAWSWLNDNVNNGKIDYTLNLGANLFQIPSSDKKIELNNLTFKTGIFFDLKQRDYKIRYFQISDRSLTPENNKFRILPIETIYSTENFGTGKWNMLETSKPSDNYSADNSLFASYILSDFEFNFMDVKTRFIGGARFENFKQNVYTTLTPDSPTADTASISKFDILPSFNLTFWFSEEMNLRLAYSNTVNRPEFREMSKSIYYDNNKFEWLYGNVNLKRALVRNYDFRYEYYPSPNEIVATSFFFKNFTDAIEEEILITAGDVNRTWFNSPKASNFGWEFEFKKNINNSFNIQANYTRVFSDVNYVKISGNSINPIISSATRPLQGQSPWMLNLNVGYTNPEINNSINFVINSYGRRLDAVLGYGDEDIYEKSRLTFDVNIVQPLNPGISLKFSAKEIGSPDLVLTKGGMDYRRTKKGTTYSLQFSFDIMEVSNSITK